jgi:FAD/FMN-containing dehydrogenase
MHALTGVAWLYCDPTDLAQAKTIMAGYRAKCTETGGIFSIPRCPDEWKRALPIWGLLGPEVEWMRRLRNALDPNHVLNPGRFVVE